MPITSVTSYVSTAAAVRQHWQSVNAARPTAPVILPDGMTLADFIALENGMNAAFDVIPAAAATQRQNSAALMIARNAFQPRFVKFNQAVRLYLSGTRFADAAPKVPAVAAGEEVFRDGARALRDAWADIDAATDISKFSPPLVLPNDNENGAVNYTLAQFNLDSQALMDDFSQEGSATLTATQKRRDRDALLPAMYAAIKMYRDTLILLLPKDSPLLETLPRLTPKAGTTPKPLDVSGVWDNVLGKARFTWPLWAGKDGEKLQVRGCLGAWKTEDEEIIADLPLDATHFETDFGLTAPGAIASFKVYIVTSTGNESGGKAVKIARPVLA